MIRNSVLTWGYHAWTCRSVEGSIRVGKLNFVAMHNSSCTGTQPCIFTLVSVKIFLTINRYYISSIDSTWLENNQGDESHLPFQHVWSSDQTDKSTYISAVDRRCHIKRREGNKLSRYPPTQHVDRLLDSWRYAEHTNCAIHILRL